MRIIILLTILFLCSANQTAFAKIIQYVDDKGKTWYVDRLEAVPLKYRAKLSEKQKATLLEKTQEPATPNPLIQGLQKKSKTFTFPPKKKSTTRSKKKSPSRSKKGSTYKGSR